MNLMQTKRCLLLLVLLALVVFGEGCSMRKSKGKPTNENIFRFALTGDVETLHFSSSNKGSYVNSSYVMNLLFEGLLRKGENDIPEPAIAHKVDVSRDQKKYIFHLRECKWSDGHEITAYDFE